MNVKKFACIALAVLSLAACASDKKDAAATTVPPADVPKPICPQVAVVRGVDTVRDFGGEAAELSQLVAAAKMTGIEGDCDYRDDGIDLAFRILFLAQRGPRLGGDRVSFPYFVAVLGPHGEILNKNQMTAEIAFQDNDPMTKHDEALHVVIPMTSADWVAGPQHRVLVGFQITPAQQKALEPLAPSPKTKKHKKSRHKKH